MRQEILSGPERRRRWSVDEKVRILAEAEVEGSRVADIARRHDITRQHVYQWRRELRGKGLLSLAPPVFLPVELASEIPCRNRDDGDAVWSTMSKSAFGMAVPCASRPMFLTVCFIA
jgi:transposase-like protein